MEGRKDLQNFKQQADSFVCSVLPDSPSHQVFISPGGLVHLRDGANAQYATGTAFLFSIYSNILGAHKQEVVCGNKKFNSARLMAFAKQQVQYPFHASISSKSQTSPPHPEKKEKKNPALPSRDWPILGLLHHPLHHMHGIQSKVYKFDSTDVWESAGPEIHLVLQHPRWLELCSPFVILNLLFPI